MTRIERFVEEIKEEILGKQYELSFAFISKNKIKFLNNKYRKVNKATDVLSFPLDKNNGEILICKEIAKKNGHDSIFLVIHAILHLKGLRHGDKMERYERAYYSRYRYRHL